MLLLDGKGNLDVSRIGEFGISAEDILGIPEVESILAFEKPGRDCKSKSPEVPRMNVNQFYFKKESIQMSLPNETPPFLDYSQYYLWLQCPARWYEKTVNRREPAWPPGQRGDALAIGSLVHSGLEVWQKTHQVSIPQEIIEEIGPTREALDMCMSMVYGYAKVFPEERWSLIRTEAPLRFPLLQTCDSGIFCGGCSKQDDVNYDGLAKLDEYFYVPEMTSIPSGVYGQEITLTPGWWVQEYKTKDPGLDLGMWMRKWEANMQASFQLLALKAHLHRETYPYEEITPQGILLTILEKPKLYEPKRKCKSCQRQYAFDLWLPTEEGLYSCPVCGNVQKVAKLKDNPSVSEPAFYRMLVQRSSERLARDLRQLQSIAKQMQYMRSEGLDSVGWNTELCIEPRFAKQCPYFNNHIPQGAMSTLDDTSMIQVKDYVYSKT